MEKATNIILFFLAFFGFFLLIGAAGSYEIGKISTTDFTIRSIIGLFCIGFPILLSWLSEKRLI